jgi:hypothetical protein
VSAPVARRLVPPRPNLGPEPWPEQRPWFPLLWIAAGLLVISRLRARRKRPPQNVRPSVGTDATPRERLVALSDTIREDLSTRFGASWRAKTTEELSADGQLEELLGAEMFPDLIRLLDRVDRLKFAPERANNHQATLQQEMNTWEGRIGDVRAKILAKPPRRPVARGSR